MVQSDLGPARLRIARPALAQRVRAALARGMLMLVAEAGFGKTTVLEEALGDHTRVAWVRCRGADQDARRFLLHVIDAVTGAAPGAADVLAEDLSSPAPIDVTGATRELVAELRRLLVDRLVIVIDDAELLVDAPAALEVVAEFLAEPGDSYGVAVATRHALPLRLAKLRATGRLEEVGAAELAFDAAECAELMRAQMDHEPSEGEVDEVMTATEGWPLGIALSAAYGAGPLPATRERVFEFLDEEVLQRAPGDVRDRLLASSVIPELEPDTLRALGLGDDLIEQVRRIGLQLRRSDEHGRTVAYQPLVREFLLSRLGALWAPERRRDLHARAAAVMAAAGRDFEAVEHWLAAERWQEAVAAIAAQPPGLAATAPESVERWLGLLPAEMRAAPACRLLEGELAWARGRHDLAAEHLRSAIEQSRSEGDAVTEWRARFALCEPLSMVGRFEEMAALADGFDTSGVEAAPAAAATGFYGAIAYGCLGRVGDMDLTVTRLLEHPAGGMFRSLRVAWEQFSLVPQGRFAEFERAMADATAEYQRADTFNRMPQLLLVGALTLMDQGRDDEALAAWLRTEEAAGRAHMQHLVMLARVERGRIHVRSGRPGEAEAELARSGPPPSGWEAYAWELVRAGVAALRGRSAEAVEAAEKTARLAASATVLERARIALDLAPILYDAGVPARARSLVDDSLELLDAHYPGAAGRYLRSLFLGMRASILLGVGDTAAAVAELQQAWVEAGTNQADLVRRLGSRLRPVLWSALELRALAADAVVRANEVAWPGAGILLEFTHHPLPDVRRAAAGSLATSGRPEVVARLAELSRDPAPEVAAAARAIAARVSADPPPLSFRLFGGFSVRRGSWEADDAAWERRIAKRLVEYLLAHREAAVLEDELVEAFWPDKGVDAARRSLQVALSSARAVLDVPGADSAIETAARTYRLKLRARDSVDVDAFERAAGAALAASGPERVDLLERAERLWGGEPLPEERYSDWAIPWREALNDRYGAVLGALVETHLRRGDHAAARDAGHKLVELDELNETAHRSLMLVYARSGRRAHALRQYLDCRRRLIAELGLEPAAETTALQRRILAGDPV